MPIYGLDISSYQGNPNMGAVAQAGNDYVIIKATEGVGYVNPMLAATRDNAHAAGRIVGLYGFASNGDPIAEAQFFVNTIGGLRDNEFPALDWEVPGDAANWSKAWLDEVQRLTGVKPFVYLNQFYVNNFDWSAVAAAGYPLWLAVYDGDPSSFPPMRYFGSPPLKQYTNAAQIPGIAGNVDRNSFNGDRNALLAYCKGGAAPSAPLEDDMRLVRTPDGAVSLVTAYDVQVVPDPDHYQALQDAGIPVAQVSPAAFARLVDLTQARRNSLMTEMSRSVLCQTPSDRTGAWLWDRVAGVDDKTGEIAAKVGTGGIDPADLQAAVTAAVTEALKNIQVVTNSPTAKRKS